MKYFSNFSKGLLILIASMTLGTLFGQTNTLVLDGKGAYLNMPESVSTTSDDFTFETWFYYTGPQRWARILDFGNDVKTNMFLTASGAQANTPRFLIKKDGKTEFFDSKVKLQANKWYHTALVFQAKTVIFYLDGEVVAEKKLTTTLSDLGTLKNKWIGKPHFSWDDYLKANLAEVRIWNVARTTDQIKESMTCALEGSEDGLSTLYQFNINGDSVVVDTKGANFGILRGDEGVSSLVVDEEIATKLKNCSEEEVATGGENALHFDGKGDMIDLGNPAFYANSFALEAWIKPTGKGTGTVFNLKDQGSNSSMFLMFNGNGQLRFTLRNPAANTGGVEVISNTAFTDDRWHHIAAVKGDDDKTYLYVDGKLEKTSSRTIPDFEGPKPYTALLGVNIPRGAERFYKGAMDEVRIWDRARSQEEIAADYDKALTGTEAGLHAYYRFNQGIPGGNNTGQTTLIDGAGKANGTLQGFALTGEQSNYVTSGVSFKETEVVSGNNALYLDGSNDFIDARATATGLPQGREPRTMEAWVKTTQTSIGNILSWGRRVTRMRNSIAVRSGKLAFIGQSLDFTGKTAINDGEWHHVALTYDGENWAIYVDGQADGTNAADPNTTDQNLKIGNLPDPSNGEYFNGTMDELRIWKVARTAEEIAAYMNTELTGKEEDLVAYYNFNQGVAGGDNPTVTTLMDQAGNNNGTLIGFTLSGKTSNWVTSTPVIKSVDAGPIAALFEHYNYGGKKVELGIGEYNAPLEIGNNGLSSVKVKPGYQVILFDEADFEGASVTITEEVAILGASEWNFNDKATSIRIESIAEDSDALAGKLFSIKKEFSGGKIVCLGTADEDNGKAGSRVQGHESNGSVSQRWEFIKTDEDTYQIRTKAEDGSHLYLEAGSSKGSPIMQASSNGAKSQEWKLTQNENGTYRLQTIAAGGGNRSIDLDPSNGLNGSLFGKTHMWNTYNGSNQEWILEKVK